MRKYVIKVWFLLVLLSIQNGHPIVYRGFMGYESEEKCLEPAILAENFMAEIEVRKGSKTFWMESVCIPFDVFKKTKDIEKNENRITYES